jgi:hypothetical protein
MKDLIRFEPESLAPEATAAESELDLVVPFTDPVMTRAAVRAANRLGEGLGAALRLVRVQLVPFPCDLDQPPIPLDFLREQLRNFRSALPMQGEVRLARDFQTGLVTTLRKDSTVILASKKRLWTTRTERLAAALRRAGYRTILVFEGEN